MNKGIPFLTLTHAVSGYMILIVRSHVGYWHVDQSNQKRTIIHLKSGEQLIVKETISDIAIDMERGYTE